MSEEEKKVINFLKQLQEELKRTLENNSKMKSFKLEFEYVNTILNLIERQQKELDIANNIINKMAKKINQAYFDENNFQKEFEKMLGIQEKADYGYVVDVIKQYFRKKVEKC